VNTIIGLNGLNALLVRADTEEEIDQLEQLIKLLDQPVKQVIVETMIVKMDVKDAFALGVSWTFAGMPLSVVSANSGAEGNFAIRYIRGNLRVALATTLTTSSSRVVQAPRVIVQNGGEGHIEITDSVPFITMDESTDVFGRTTSTPNISFEDFTQGLDVYDVMIHPDDTITMEIAPIIEIPTVSVGIPGGAGGVSGANEFTIDQRVRVKNGETIMLGGFSTKDEEQGGMRAPLLSNLPIIGPLLFRNKSRATSNTEMLVFVTPTIMKEDTTNFDGMKSLPPLF
jgi:type II secretory pathway component GspD/PulD (secretin)